MVGGGVAGLQAAVLLSAAGMKTVIVEARDRLGGRISTLRIAPTAIPVELGAEFVHGRPPEILSVAEEAGMNLGEVSGEPWFSNNGRLEPCGNFFAQVDEVMQDMGEPTGPDQSFREFLDRRYSEEIPEKAHALRYVEGFHAARAERISVRGLIKGDEASAQIDGDTQYWVTGGYDTLVRYLEKQLSRASICLETVVQEVHWTEQLVNVRAVRNGEAVIFTAPQALITLPLAVLQGGSVRFDPVISEKNEALRLLEMGSALRITFRFREEFWSKLERRGLQNLSFLFSGDQELPTWWAKRKIRLLTGWAGGPNAAALSALSDTDFVAHAIASLSRILNIPREDIEHFVESWHFHNWVKDPFCGGGYSYALVGGEDAARRLAAPLSSTLSFAGEATEFTGHHGTVNGAMASGVRAANEMLDRIFTRKIA